MKFKWTFHVLYTCTVVIIYVCIVQYVHDKHVIVEKEYKSNILRTKNPPYIHIQSKEW